MTERLLKNQFIISVLALVALFVLSLEGKVDGNQFVLGLLGTVGAFLHFESKVPA
jgi:hypothetical protein